jgi:hypothetical protein
MPMRKCSEAATKMIETVLVATGVALLSMLFFALAPRCPECGSCLSETSQESPRVHHCRKCLTTYEVKR